MVIATLKSISEGRDDVFQVDPALLTIITDPAHILFDERAALPVRPEFLASILEHGVQEPIKVKRNGSAWEVVNGRQRVKAAREANKQLTANGREPILVPVVAVVGDEFKALKLMVALNEHRSGDDPVTQAQKAARLIQRGIPIKEVAAQFGLKLIRFRELLAVLDTTPKVMQLVASRQLSVQTAAGISALPREVQDAKVAELQATVGLNRDTVAASVKARKTGDAKIQVAPKRALVLELATAMDKHAPGTAALLRWVLTGANPENANGPFGKSVQHWLDRR